MMISKRVSGALLAALLAGCSGGGDSPPANANLPAPGLVSVSQAGASAQMVSRATVAVTGYRANYVISIAAETGIVTLTHKTRNTAETYPAGTLFKFLDMYTSLDPKGPESEIYRLYQAAFDRKPDIEGLGFWVQAYRNGVSLDAIAGGFLASAEFTAKYGDTVSDASFILAAYANVLHRVPEQTGVQFWLAALNNGSPRPAVLHAFSESAENQANLLPAIRAGADFILPRQDGDRIVPRMTAYENKNIAGLDNPTVPEIFGVPNIVLEPGEQNFSQRALAFADFSQNGRLDTAVTFSTMYKGVNTDGSNPYHWSDSPSKLYFLQKTAGGAWTDVTSNFIKDPSARRACVSPGFLEVSDFNNDGKPDVFVSCTGPDYPIVSKGNRFDDLSPQFILLSQPDNTYKLVQLPIAPIYSHQSTVADVDGDGNADIITVNTAQSGKPFVMFGNGDGTFRTDFNAFPADTLGMSIFGIVGVPVDGKLNVILSGNPPGSSPSSFPADYGTRVLQYIDGKFQYVADLTAGIPIVAGTSLKYGLMFDAIYKDGFYYTSRVANDYSSEAIIKVNAATGASSILMARPSGGANGAGSAGTLKLTSKGELVNYMADCNVDVAETNFFYHACKMHIPAN